MNKKIIIPIVLLTLFSLAVFVSAKETLIGRGSMCDNIVENAGSVRLVSFSYPNVEIEITANDYIGNAFLGFFHPMKLMTENLAAEIKIEKEIYSPPRSPEQKIEQDVYIYGPDHLNLILTNYYNYGKYPFTEKFNLRVGPYHYKIHLFLKVKTFWDFFTVKCTQATLGVIELCADQPDGKCPLA